MEWVPPAHSAHELHWKCCQVLVLGAVVAGEGRSPCRGEISKILPCPGLSLVLGARWCVCSRLSQKRLLGPGSPSPGAGGIGGRGSRALECQCSIVSQPSVPSSQPPWGGSPPPFLTSSWACAHHPCARDLLWGPGHGQIKEQSGWVAAHSVNEALPAWSLALCSPTLPTGKMLLEYRCPRRPGDPRVGDIQTAAKREQYILL